MTKICFECGELHEGFGVICEPCEARLEEEKNREPEKPRRLFFPIMDALMVIASLLMM